MKKRRYADRDELGLSPVDFRTLARLDSPEKVQQFLNDIPANFEIGGETSLSVQEVLRQKRAHCIEGAMVAACALWIHGDPPLLLDLRAERDYDHVVTLFRRHGCWGAVSKTNPPLLRWRDPVYRTLRELAISYFHEYANKRHQKTLREYSRPFDLRRVKPEFWVTGKKQCWTIGAMLDETRHYRLIDRKQAAGLRLRDPIERKAGALKEYARPAITRNRDSRTA